MLGPLDFVVLGFEGNNFDGSILAELKKASESGTIRVVDLLFVLKDAEGNILAAEVQDQGDEIRATVGVLLPDDDTPLLTEDDMNKVGSNLENNTSAAILIIEHLWAVGLKTAIIDAGGEVIDQGRINAEAAEAALEDIEAEAK